MAWVYLAGSAGCLLVIGLLLHAGWQAGGMIRDTLRRDHE